jgi:hypothetical protein
VYAGPRVRASRCGQARRREGSLDTLNLVLQIVILVCLIGTTIFTIIWRRHVDAATRSLATAQIATTKAQATHTEMILDLSGRVLELERESLERER